VTDAGERAFEPALADGLVTMATVDAVARGGTVEFGSEFEFDSV